MYEMTDWSSVGTTKTESSFQPELAGRLARTLWYEDDGRKYGHAAISGSYGWPDANSADNQARYRTRPEARSESRWLDTGRISGADSMALLGLEGVANLGRTQLVGEVMNSWVARGQGSPNVSFWGGYVYASYFLTEDHMPWSRKSGTLSRIKPSTELGKSGWGAWQVAARLSYGDFTDQDIMGGVGKSVTLGLNWYWNSHARLQLNYIHGRLDDRVATSASPPPATFPVSGDYDILGLRLMVDF